MFAHLHVPKLSINFNQYLPYMHDAPRVWRQLWNMIFTIRIAKTRERNIVHAYYDGVQATMLQKMAEIAE